MTKDQILQERKERIEKRLKKHGITGTSITFLEYLIFDENSFATPFEVGCRIMILYSIVYTIEDSTKKEAVIQWLKRENIWKYVGERETEYLEGRAVDQENINEFSWQIEGAYILAWALDLVTKRPSPTGGVTDEQMDEFIRNVIPLGSSTNDFLVGLSYRNTEEIFEENIFYELATAYFRDLLFNGNEDTTDIDRFAAFERHKALNWLRRFMDIPEWEQTDTST